MAVMDDIKYDKEAFEEVAGSYSSAKDQAMEISEGIKDSIAKIKTAWIGSDDVIASRDEDFKKIEENLETINSYLQSTSKYLAEKNESFTSAGSAYRAG